MAYRETVGMFCFFQNLLLFFFSLLLEMASESVCTLKYLLSAQRLSEPVPSVIQDKFIWAQMISGFLFSKAVFSKGLCVLAYFVCLFSIFVLGS